MGRVILHHGIDPQAAGTAIDDRVVGGCWFEWHRQGGCGPGELKLERSWVESADVRPGDWISIGPSIGDRWYLGRVEEWRADYPAGVVVKLGGMVNELNEVFPGGLGPNGIAPQRYGATDAFPHDPDYSLQQYHATQSVQSIVTTLVQQQILPRTHVTSVGPITAPISAGVDSITMRGEESVRSLLKDLAVRAGGAAWGVDEQARFYFQPDGTAVSATYQLAGNVTRCAATRSRDILFNRLQITGDYIYDRLDRSDNIAQRVYRFRQIHVRDTSVTAYGEHRIRLWLPWIRTDDDAYRFAEAFFDLYAAPPTKYLVEAIADVAQPPKPWLGRVQLADEAGNTIASGVPSVVRVRFDECPTVRMEIGPEDPRRLWPEPPEDERYELPTIRKHSESSLESTSLASFSSVPDESSLIGGTTGGTTNEPPTSEPVPTSFATSDWTSATSLLESQWSSIDPSSGYDSLTSEWPSSEWPSSNTESSLPGSTGASDWTSQWSTGGSSAATSDAFSEGSTAWESSLVSDFTSDGSGLTSGASGSSSQWSTDANGSETTGVSWSSEVPTSSTWPGSGTSLASITSVRSGTSATSWSSEVGGSSSIGTSPDSSFMSDAILTSSAVWSTLPSSESSPETPNPWSSSGEI